MMTNDVGGCMRTKEQIWAGATGDNGDVYRACQQTRTPYDDA